MSAISWEVAIDWNGDGTFEDVHTSSSGSLEDVAIRAGRERAGDEFAGASASFTLENPDGRYSRYNAASPLYGYLRPGAAVRIRATHAAVTYQRFLGELEEPDESYTAEGVPAVKFQAQGAFERLRRGSVRLSLQENKRVDQILGAICDAAAWPAGRRTFGTAEETLDLFWVHRQTPLDALKLAAHQELGGQFYERADGNLVFESRGYRAIAPVTATISDAVEVRIPQRYDDLIDRVTHTYAGLTADSALSVVWSLSPAGYQLDPGSASARNTIFVEFNDGAKGATAPIAGTDYHANAQADGAGADKTAQVSVASFTAWAGGAAITFNNADSAPVYLVGSPAAQVRGYALRRSSDERAIEVFASSPVVSEQELSDRFDFNDAADRVRSFATWRAEALSQNQPRPSVTLLTSTDAEIALALGIEISQRLTLSLTAGLYPPHIAGDFFVEGYELAQKPDEDLSCVVHLFSVDQGGASHFRISGSAASGVNYSQIAAAGAVYGDRISY